MRVSTSVKPAGKSTSARKFAPLRTLPRNTFGQSAVKGNCLEFSNTSGYGVIASPVDGLTSGSATIEAWINSSFQPDPSTSPSGQTILLGAASPGAQPRIAVDAQNRLNVYWSSSGEVASFNSADTTPVTDGQWHHVALVFDNGTVTFYKDGLSTDSVSIDATLPASSYPQIGPGLGSSTGFVGQIFDVRVWNQPRRLDEIQGYMYAATDGTLAGELNNLKSENGLLIATSFDVQRNAIVNLVDNSVGSVANCSVVQAQLPVQPTPSPVWSFTATAPGESITPPVLAAGAVICTDLALEDGVTHALIRSVDLQDNSVVNWTFDAMQEMTGQIFSSVRSQTVADGAVYAVVPYSPAYSTYLYSIDLASGQTNWSVPFAGAATASKVVANGGLALFGTTITDSHANFVAMNICAINMNGQQRWEFCPGIYQSGNVNYHPYWTNSTISTAPFSLSSSVTCNSGVVVVGLTRTSDGTEFQCSVFVLDPSTGETLCSWDIESGPHSQLTGPPIISNNQVYAATQSGKLYALTPVVSKPAWTFSTSAGMTSNPAIFGSAILLGDQSGNLYAVDASSGAEQWSLNLGTQIDTDLFIQDGIAYLVTQAGLNNPTFYAIDLATQGSDVLSYPINDSDLIVFSGASANGVVYFASFSSIYGVNMTNVIHEFSVQYKLIVDNYNTSTTPYPTANDTAYRLAITLYDPLKNPRPMQAIKVWSAGSFYLNNFLDNAGNPTMVGPDNPVWLETDATGQVVLAFSAYDNGLSDGTGVPLVGAPAVFAWANFMYPSEVITIYPDHENIQTLTAVQGNSPTGVSATGSSQIYLNQAQGYPDNNLNYPPLLDQYDDSSAASVAARNSLAQAIQNTMGQTALHASLQSTNSAKYMAYPASMPNVVYQPDNTQPSTRPLSPGAVQNWQFIFSDPSNNGQPSFTPLSGVQSIEGDFSLISAHDFLHRVASGAEKIAHQTWTWVKDESSQAMQVITNIVTDVENSYQIVITTVEDAARMVTAFFKSVVADLRKVIQWLSELLDLKNYIINHRLIASSVTTQITNMQNWVTAQITCVNNNQPTDLGGVFAQFKGSGSAALSGATSTARGNQVQDYHNSTGDPNAIYNTGGNNNSMKCQWMSQKTAQNVPGASFSLQTIKLGLGSSTEFDPDAVVQAFEAFLSSVGEAIKENFVAFSQQFHEKMEGIKDQFKDPASIVSNGLSAVLAVFEVLAEDMIGIAEACVPALLTLLDTILQQISNRLTQTIQIPFISDLYRSLTGSDLSLLDLIALLVAVPVTVLLDVLTGQATPPQTESSELVGQNVGWTVEQVFAGLSGLVPGGLSVYFDPLSYILSNLPDTNGGGGEDTPFFSGIDFVVDTVDWALSMAISQGWNTGWSGKDWGFWACQSFYLGASLFFDVKSMSPIQAGVDVAYGAGFIVMACLYAHYWNSSYLNAPKAPGLVLTSNIFSGFSYLMELGYFAGDDGVIAVGLCKGVVNGITTVLNFTAFNLDLAANTVSEMFSPQRPVVGPAIA